MCGPQHASLPGTYTGVPHPSVLAASLHSAAELWVPHPQPLCSALGQPGQQKGGWCAAFPPNLVFLCVHVIVIHLHCAAAARSHPTSPFPLLSQAYPECLLPPSTVCLEPGQCHFYHNLCLFSALLASLPLLVPHSWTLPAHPGLNGFTLNSVSRLHCLSTGPIAPQTPQTCSALSRPLFACAPCPP